MASSEPQRVARFVGLSAFLQSRQRIRLGFPSSKETEVSYERFGSGTGLSFSAGYAILS